MFDRLEENFGIDQNEFGRMLMVASLTLLVVSIHSFYSLSKVEKKVESVENSFETSQALLNSDSFQRSLQGLKDLPGGSDTADQVSSIVKGLQRTEKSFNRTEKAIDLASSRKRTYQWLSLIGIVGLIGGAGTIFL